MKAYRATSRSSQDTVLSSVPNASQAQTQWVCSVQCSYFTWTCPNSHISLNIVDMHKSPDPCIVYRTTLFCCDMPFKLILHNLYLTFYTSLSYLLWHVQDLTECFELAIQYLASRRYSVSIPESHRNSKMSILAWIPSTRYSAPSTSSSHS